MSKIKMIEQPPKERVKNFSEVALGLSEKDAVEEAKRCLQCKKAACVGGCPVNIDIPVFIKLISVGEFEKAYEKLKEKNMFPAICGRVCPQEDQCEKMCVLSHKKSPIGIGYLERFAADYHFKNRSKAAPETLSKKTGKKVAVIGSGPAGLTCSAELAKKGFNVTLFESLHKAGGVLVYGIPEFRLPKNIVEAEIEYLRSLGVNIVVNRIIGEGFDIEDLRREGYEAFFIATGAGLPYFMGIPGENLNGVYSANEYLTRINLMKAYKFPQYDTPVTRGKNVAVVGAGNVAMDSARCAIRLGASKVTIIYRRTEAEMPARLEEIERAKEEGIEFRLLTNPTRIIGDDSGWVKSMELIKNSLGEPDKSGRPRPVAITGSEYIESFDTIVVAIGQGPNPLLIKKVKGLKLNEKGNVVVDHEAKTNIAGVFAGGDIATGAATVISAMGAGKIAARNIEKYLS